MSNYLIPYYSGLREIKRCLNLLRKIDPNLQPPDDVWWWENLGGLALNVTWKATRGRLEEGYDFQIRFGDIGTGWKPIFAYILRHDDKTRREFKIEKDLDFLQAYTTWKELEAKIEVPRFEIKLNKKD